MSRKCKKNCSCCQHKHPRVEMSASSQTASRVYTPATEEQPRCNIYSITYEPENTEASFVIPSPNRLVKCKLNYAAAVRKCLSPPSATAAVVPAVTCQSAAAPVSSPNVSSTTVLKIKAEPKDLLDSSSGVYSKGVVFHATSTTCHE